MTPQITWVPGYRSFSPSRLNPSQLAPNKKSSSVHSRLKNEKETVFNFWFGVYRLLIGGLTVRG